MDHGDRAHPPLRDWLGDGGLRRPYASGEVLFRQGDHTDHVVLIEEGLARVTITAPSGHLSVVAFRGPGELVGDFAALDGRPRSATCTAVEDLIAIVMTAERFLAALSAHSELALLLLRRTVERVRETDRWRSEFGACSARDRVVLVLTELVRRRGRPVPGDAATISITVSHAEIAGAAGTSRDSVLRALRSLGAEGILQTRRGRIVLTNLQALADLAARHRS